MTQKIKKAVLISLISFAFIGKSFAQGPAPIETPLDPISLTVLIGGGVLAVKKMKADKKEKDSDQF